MPKTTKTPVTPTAAEKKGTDESRSDRSRTPKTPGGHTEVRTPRTLSIGSRRRPYEFDSTLGYPCEGPVKLMGWNANGLCDKLHFAASLRKARTGREGRAGVDAIMVLASADTGWLPCLLFSPVEATSHSRIFLCCTRRALGTGKRGWRHVRLWWRARRHTLPGHLGVARRGEVRGVAPRCGSDCGGCGDGDAGGGGACGEARGREERSLQATWQGREGLLVQRLSQGLHKGFRRCRPSEDAGFRIELSSNLKP